MTGGESYTPDELARQHEADHGGDPYLLYRDRGGGQRVFSLSETRATVGRSISADLVLGWDQQVSNMHAELERMGDDWVLLDDGLSRNGSFVNGERVSGRRRLLDRDVLRFGTTELTFCARFQAGRGTMIAPALPAKPPEGD